MPELQLLGPKRFHETRLDIQKNPQYLALLDFVGVTQNLDGDCADGSCGPNPGVPSNPPCDPNTDIPPPDVTYTIPLTTSEIEGFTRVQQAVPAPPVSLP